MALLELDKLSLSFGGLKALSELDISVDQGEVVSIIGPNGAGKSTVFNVVTGVYEPSSGDVRFDGKTIAGLVPYKITRRGIARTFQSLRLFLNMSVKENVMAATYGATKTTPLSRSSRSCRGPAARSAKSESSPRTCWDSSASAWRATAGTSRPTASPTQTAAVSRSPVRWQRSHGCCCSTSPPPA